MTFFYFFSLSFKNVFHKFDNLYTIMELEDNEFENGENMNDDWYNQSDTDESIPDPNKIEDSLFQKADTLPVPIDKVYFEEGLVYFMSLRSKRDTPMLIFLVEKLEEVFIYRVFFVRGSSKNTFHQSGKCAECRYEDVWRLAPRDELVRKQQVTDIFVGQTLRYICSVRDKPGTMMVTKISRTTVTGILECGKNRGETKTIQKYEIVESQEIFGSSLLHSILQKVKKLDWAEVKLLKSQNAAQSLALNSLSQLMKRISVNSIL